MQTAADAVNLLQQKARKLRALAKQNIKSGHLAIAQKHDATAEAYFTAAALIHSAIGENA